MAGERGQIQCDESERSVGRIRRVGQRPHRVDLEEKQTAVAQEVGEGATVTLNPERVASNPWKKGRGGRQKRFSPVGERPHRRRHIKVKNPNRLGVA